MLKTLLKILFILFSTQIFAKDQDYADIALQSFKSENKLYVAVIFKNAEHWHTYWKNPGDAGTAPEFEWKFENKKIEILPLEWPAPQVFIEQGDMMAYGYEGEYAFYFELPRQALQKETPFHFQTKWLICNNLCIWGERKVQGKFKDETLSLSDPAPFSWTEEKLIENLKTLPYEETWPSNLNLRYYLSEDKENLVAKYEWTKQEKGPVTNLLFPFPNSPFLYKRENLVQNEQGIIEGTLPVQWDGKYKTPEFPLPVNGIFNPPQEQKFVFIHPETKKASVIKIAIKDFSLTPPPQKLAPLKEKESSVFLYLFFAFLGGLILNLMPCVLPVISLKLFGILKRTKISPREILTKNLAYTFGILFSFSILAFVVIGLKRSGEEIGWGFQLQSPLFISTLIVILFVFALNLFGLFEFKTPGGRFLGTIKVNQHYTGDIVEGILATLLSTPCSAPFLGTALTFAFHSSPLMILAIFLCIGLGLAFPFILSGFFPQTIHWLPKPGVWMENLKRFLGLALLLTIIWLFYVLLSQIDRSILLVNLLLSLTLIFFTFFLSYHITKKKVWRILFVILSLLSLCSFFYTSKNTALVTTLEWEMWSKEKMSTPTKTTFIDFTAQWCLTCKVNENLVLKSDDFKALVKKHDLRLLVGDWTKKDPAISEFLEKNGSSAVPAYFVQAKDGKLIKLSELISISKIEEALREAEKK